MTNLRVGAFSFLFFTLCVVVANVFAQEQRTPPPGVKYDANLDYGTGGGETLRLDLARPEKQDGPLPCIVVIHGGAWRGGNKIAHTDIIWNLARQGFVAATVQYRFAPKHHFPAQVEDVKCAVRYLRAHAEEYGIDKERFGAMGFSAGGHLSQMLGVMDKDDGMEGSGGHEGESSKVQAVVNFFGPVDFLADDIPEQVEPLVDDFVGAKRDEKPELRRAASPVTYVNEGDAPTLMFQGTRDPLVPHTQAFRLTDKLTAAGVPGRVELLLGAGHGWGGPMLNHTSQRSVEFFKEQLGKR